MNLWSISQQGGPSVVANAVGYSSAQHQVQSWSYVSVEQRKFTPGCSGRRTLELSDPFAHTLCEFPVSKLQVAGALTQQLRLSVLGYPELLEAFLFIIRVVLGVLVLPPAFAAFGLFCVIAIFSDKLEQARASR